ncbi:MAG: regulator of sigma E protease [Sphingobacteriales bacterium]|jgi:regulator of sigma E protease
MQGLVMAAQLIAGLSILIILHELGHFVAARAFGIKVEKFFLFFDAWGFKLFSKKFGDTEYGIGWLPLGGYVKIAGMIDESMDKEQMAKPPQPWEFRSKPAWQRLIVMIGGVVVNIVLGVVIYWMLAFGYGDSKLPLSEIKHGLVPSVPAQEIGIQLGDKITKVNGENITYLSDIISADVLLGGVMLTIERNGEEIELPVPNDMLDKMTDAGNPMFVVDRQEFIIGDISPGSNAESAGLKKGDKVLAIDSTEFTFFDEFKAILDSKTDSEIQLSVLREGENLNIPVKVTDEGKIGFLPMRDGELKLEIIKYGLFSSFKIGVQDAFASLTANVRGIGKVVTGQISAQKSLQGPIGIAKIYGGEFDWRKFWTLTGMISMILAFMNILPIPALDGGHTVFLIIEMIAGKPLSDKFLETAQVVGFVLLIVLMVFVFGNDIYNLFN